MEMRLLLTCIFAFTMLTDCNAGIRRNIQWLASEIKRIDEVLAVKIGKIPALD